MSTLKAAEPTSLDVLLPQRARRQVVLRSIVIAVAGACCLYVALATGNGIPAGARPGDPGGDGPGALVELGLPALRLASWLLGSTVFGAVMLLVLIPLGPHDRVRLEALTFAARVSIVWAGVVVVQLVFAAARGAGTSLRDLSWATTREAAVQLPVQALAVQVAFIGLTAVAASVAAGTPLPGGRLALAVALLALVPPIASGHPGEQQRPLLVVALLVVHVAAAAAWVGGLSAVLWSVRRGAGAMAVTIHRFSGVALVCATAITGTGVIDAMLRVEPSAHGVLGNGYGQIVVAKLVGTGVLSAIGLVHRLRTLPAIRAGQAGAFVRFAVVEMVVMGAIFGLATALAQTPS